jgi:transcriptional regulator GlxA family with amidase domain
MSSDPSRPTVRVGVFMPTTTQLLDGACIDIIGSMSWQYLQSFEYLVPKTVRDMAPNVDIHYIGSVKAGEHIQVSANQKIVATNHFSDAEVAPGKLEIVIVPGPDPFTKQDEKALKWLRLQSSSEGTDILSVCTGIFICGQAGLLQGKTVCGPRPMQNAIKEQGFGVKELVGHKYRWVQDGNFWSAGGVTNGNDLVAAYCRQSKHFAGPVVELACNMCEVGDREQEYGDNQLDYGLNKV